MSEDPNVRLVLDVASALAATGPKVLVDRYHEWFSEDFEWRPILGASLDGRAYRGREEFRRYGDEILEAFPDVVYRFDRAEAVDDRRVLVTGEIRGSGVGSGAPIDRQAAYVLEVANGRLTGGWSFWSVEEAEEFLADA